MRAGWEGERGWLGGGGGETRGDNGGAEDGYPQAQGVQEAWDLEGKGSDRKAVAFGAWSCQGCRGCGGKQMEQVRLVGKRGSAR